METKILLEIGKRLRTAREHMGFTLDKAGEATGVSPGYISDFERGKKMPSSRYLLQLAVKYHVRLDFIFTGEGNLLHPENREIISPESFGRYSEEVYDLLRHMLKVPAVFYAVLHFFSIYKVEKEAFIHQWLERETERATEPGTADDKSPGQRNPSL